MKFVMAYSGGKDCTLALDRMLRAGHTCVALMVVVGIKGQYSYMHIFTRDVLGKFAESLGVPLILVPSKNKHDAAATFVFSLYMIVTTLITGAQEQSAFDELITLSTCSYHTDNGRFVVVARKR